MVRRLAWNRALKAMGVMKRIATARALGDRSRPVNIGQPWCYKTAQEKQNMAYDKIASGIVSVIALGLGSRRHTPYGDHALLDVQMELPNQLDVWLENVQTGEKIKYHVIVEKAPVQPLRPLR